MLPIATVYRSYLHSKNSNQLPPFDFTLLLCSRDWKKWKKFFSVIIEILKWFLLFLRLLSLVTAQIENWKKQKITHRKRITENEGKSWWNERHVLEFLMRKSIENIEVVENFWMTFQVFSSSFHAFFVWWIKLFSWIRGNNLISYSRISHKNRCLWWKFIHELEEFLFYCYKKFIKNVEMILNSWMKERYF